VADVLAPALVEGPIADGPDAALVARLKAGERAAFDIVYDRYANRLWRFLVRLSRRPDVAEDLAQETWMKLARAAPALRDDTNLSAWLFTVARNAWISHRRWSMLDVSRFFAMSDDDAFALDVSTGEDRADASRDVLRLEHALASIPAASREVLLLVVIEGFEQEQAAAVLGIRHDALRQRLARARTQLAEAIGREQKKQRGGP
jgi:RNA polymerase sigma-70 factor (ECF subfamily)